VERSGRGLTEELFLNFWEGLRKITKSQETRSPGRDLNPDASEYLTRSYPLDPDVRFLTENHPVLTNCLISRNK
jgi:hypothetical protein